ncbi:hypothetical protein ABB37_06448 [Leptomonas pyrrhocoris]|uniref:RING-type domain-containing protein n=1 Tax=Leptomonas pyrrhocoris TaxID=157538 RepID=A0A0N0DU23_LEPPY|nr:hypothetical protein ABB37_06448 [Leptomonas pyrrhocoris]XP_015656751.1 hypothetical protein ABB37_06448 [Leptomonas pyrrhocoris]KPA78311.1 hypothetical protein ABB37_06448 [Leptomonas pyrrhocoris]KPA78312.1 hypothetical protein ABB37_06448 [Leptomonas pyrrhocoris]|eukprot:XP_015656750.1 hypothetical protein ABB37_06448 [Leptomonas pyrrhocoris]
MFGSGSGAAPSHPGQHGGASAAGASSQTAAGSAGPSSTATPHFQHYSFSTPFGNTGVCTFVAAFGAGPPDSAAPPTTGPSFVSHPSGAASQAPASFHTAGWFGVELGEEGVPLPSSPEWPLRDCPPLNAEEVVSTFDVVTPTSSAAPREEEGCAICLESLFKDVVHGSKAAHRSRQPHGATSAVTRGHDSRSSKESEPNASALSGDSLASPSGDPARSPADGDTGEVDEAGGAPTSTEVVREVYCGHRFHEVCIRNWISIGHYKCPLCRAPFVYE